jgi:hypothetical protein
MLALTMALPWLASTLLTDIFAGPSVLSPFVLIAHGDKVSAFEKLALFGFTAFAAATHNATLGCARPLLPRLATLTVLISAARYLGGEDEPDDLSLSP